MTTPIILASSALALVLTVALIREHRLRRALQRLLSRLLAAWRNRDAQDRTFTFNNVDDPSAVPRDRL